MEELIYKLYKKTNNLFEVAQLLDKSFNDLLVVIKKSDKLSKILKNDLSGYFEPKYNDLKYRVNFEVLDIWESPDMDDENWKDYKVNILLPNLDKLTKEEQESLISVIYFDCYDLSVNVFFNNKSYNSRDNTITIQEYNGKKLSDAEAQVIIDKNDFIDNETIIELMNKMNSLNEGKMETTPCEKCMGTGKVLNKKALEVCPKCGGAGVDIDKDSSPFEVIFQNYDHIGNMFCKELGCKVDRVIGSGTQGIALRVNMENGEDKILKITKDNTEVASAKKLYNKKPKHLPVIQKGVVFESKFFPKASGKIFGILMDEYDVNSEITKYVDRVMSYIDVLTGEDAVSFMSEVDKNDVSYIELYQKLKRKGPELVWYMNQLMDVLSELERFNIKSYDFHGMNFGRNKKGDLVYFDIGYIEGEEFTTPEQSIWFESVIKENTEYKFDTELLKKLISKTKFGDYISDVKFERVGVFSTIPEFVFSYKIDFKSLYEKFKDEEHYGAPIRISKTNNKLNDLIQLIDNPNNNGVGYRTTYIIYYNDNDENPLKLGDLHLLN